MREPFFLPTTFVLVTQRKDWPKAHRHHRIYLWCVKIALCFSSSLSGAFSGSSSKPPPDAANWITMFVKPAFFPYSSVFLFAFFVVIFSFPHKRFSFRVASKTLLLTLVLHSYHTGAHYNLLQDCSDMKLGNRNWVEWFFFVNYVFVFKIPPKFPQDRWAISGVI